MTPFKIVSEYIICVILIAAGFFMLHRRKHFDKGFLGWTLASIAVTILSELAFTTYASVFGFSNLLGHFFKIVSFYLIYKAVIETGLAKPYDLLFRDLHRQHERFRVTLTSIGDAVIATDAEGRITFANPMAGRLTGWAPDEAIGQLISNVFHGIDEQCGLPTIGPLPPVLNACQTMTAANHNAIITRDGRTVPIETSAAPIKDINGHSMGVVLVFRDISERKQAEEALNTSKERSQLLAAVAQRLLRAENPQVIFDQFRGSSVMKQSINIRSSGCLWAVVNLAKIFNI